jgi:hypothetical protein
MKFDTKSKFKKLDQNQKCKKMKKKKKTRTRMDPCKASTTSNRCRILKIKTKAIDTQPAVEQSKSICAVTMHPRRPPGLAGALPSPLASTHRAWIPGSILPIRAHPARHG